MAKSKGGEIRRWRLGWVRGKSYLEVYLAAPWKLRFLAALATFLTHKIMHWVPRLPVPIVHNSNSNCEASRRFHLHNPYTWYGWNYENTLCMGIESDILGLEYAAIKRLFRVHLTPKKIAILSKADREAGDFFKEFET